jgi:hypothetical protein
MADAPDDFDWVAAQATCNTASMFERLRTRVRDDVNKRNALLARNDGWQFEFHEEGDEFWVSRLAGAEVAAAVRFERAGSRILVHGEDIDVDLTAVVTSDASGSCRFVVGETMYSDWEVRKMSLELLFFEEAD